jgi:serine/threonine-protein kinase
MPRRIVASLAVLAVLLVSGCSSTASSTGIQAPAVNGVVTVPTVAGKTEKDAIAALAAVGLTAEVRYTADKAHIGVVVAEPVPIGGTLAPGSLVMITVGYDASLASVPDVIGRTLRDAEARLRTAGLKAVSKVGPASSSDTTVSAGEVYQQSVAPGTPRPKGSSVTIFFLTHK